MQSCALSPGQKVLTTGLKTSDSFSFFPFILKRFMICCCFIPFMVQKECSCREFQLWDIPRHHLLPQPGMFEFRHYSTVSMKPKPLAVQTSQ